MTEHKDVMTPEYPAHEDCKTECWFSATMRAQAAELTALRAERDAALARVGVLEVALTGARGDILSLLHGRGCEFEGSDEDWVGDIDTILSAKLANKGKPL